MSEYTFGINRLSSMSILLLGLFIGTIIGKPLIWIFIGAAAVAFYAGMIVDSKLGEK